MRLRVREVVAHLSHSSAREPRRGGARGEGETLAQFSVLRERQLPISRSAVRARRAHAIYPNVNVRGRGVPLP